MQFIILGGGCYGSFYARQLLRAREAHAITFDRILIVDHNAEPAVRQQLNADPILHFERSEWDDFFDNFLEDAPENCADVFVPSPFNPHLGLGWLMRSLARSQPHRHFTLETFTQLPGTPFQQQRDHGTLVASHADWICPVHCIEPEICPKTRDTRYWDMDRTGRAFARALSRAGQPVDQVLLFHCHHVSYGVGGYPVAELVVARAQLGRALAASDLQLRALVGTVSRCHGAFHLLAS
ncbi:MAG: hypothetical protein ACRENP_27140 [Longimicrobiales bacterium]